MNKIELIIWDWNGTLLNDVDICIDVMNKLLVKYNYNTISRQTYQEIFTFPVKKYYQKVGFDFKKYPFEIVGNEFIDLYDREIEKALLNKNVSNVLQFVESKKINQIVISARENNALNNEVRRYEIDKYFAQISGISNNLAAGKQELFEDYFSKNDVNKENVLLIGDTIHDYQIATHFGLNFIRFAKGHQDKSHFPNKKILSIDDLIELKKYFL